MSVMNRMKVPELLQEIAAFVENSRDLSAFAQVDRFTHAVVTPCIFRNIELRLDFVDSLAVAFRNDSARAACVVRCPSAADMAKGHPSRTVTSFRNCIPTSLQFLERFLSTGI
jgi:hypothetical protein